MKGLVTAKSMIAQDNERGINYETLPFDLYDVLAMSVTGEALTIVLGVLK